MATIIAKPTQGKQMTVARLGGLVGPVGSGSQGAPTFMGIGSGSTAPAPSDVALGAEFTFAGYSRQACVMTQKLTTVANDTLQWQATFAAPGPGALTVNELGLFDAVSAGGLYARATFSTYTLNAGDQLSLAITEQQL